MNFAASLYEDPDDEKMITGWCHPRQACLVMARLNGRTVIPCREVIANDNRQWINNKAVCCGCGKFINQRGGKRD